MAPAINKINYRDSGAVGSTSNAMKPPVVSSSKKPYLHYLVLVGSRNRLECNFTIKLKSIEGLIED